MSSEQSKKLLEKMRVASPCPVSWDAMKGDDKKRFCGHCNLHVYNISSMTRSEAEEFISKREARTCVRFYRRADGTVLTEDCPVGLKALRRRLKMRLGVFASMLFGFSLTVFGQDAKSVDAKNDESKIKVTRTIDSNTFRNPAIKGTMTDLNGAVIAGVKITLTNEKTSEVISLRSNEEGEFRLEKLEAGTYTLQADAAGFKTFIKKEIEINEQESLALSATMVVNGELVGELIVTEELPVTESKVSETLIQKRELLKLPVKPKKP